MQVKAKMMAAKLKLGRLGFAYVQAIGWEGDLWEKQKKIYDRIIPGGKREKESQIGITRQRGQRQEEQTGEWEKAGLGRVFWVGEEGHFGQRQKGWMSSSYSQFAKL